MKKTERNIELYKAQVIARGYENLKPMVNQPTNDMNLLMNHLAAEGKVLLEREETNPQKKFVSKTLEDTLGQNSKNPYIRARIQVLKDLDPMRRREIAEMEVNGNTDNFRYNDFVKMVRTLGDRFSNMKD